MKSTVSFNMKERKAQLSQRDRAMLRIVEKFANLLWSMWLLLMIVR